MSDTPRADAEACWPACNDSSDSFTPDGGYVCADFARQLERELAQAKQDAECYKWLLQFLFIRSEGNVWWIDFQDDNALAGDFGLPPADVDTAIRALKTPESSSRR